MSQKRTPTGLNRQGQDEKTVVADGMNITLIPVAGQGFSACVPCASCPHFRVVRFSSKRFRHQCGHDGAWLECCGVHECTAMPEGGAA